ncbi:hypothetical protein SLEP1_g13271 [Rubroshorea leprosula]|uniref:Ribosomal protein S6 n=1 Tax=Rubroshorea leprosula TaxID=152421 RepID=A0AAV5IKZ5_9ROSI|nr:hypothetical protein SLEP1_g13271 [Rubroshorea leprosula]
MTMMATPNINKELHYLNKEDKLLRWLLVKHRDPNYGLEFLHENEEDVFKFFRGSLCDDDSDEDDDDDRAEYDDAEEASKENDGL